VTFEKQKHKCSDVGDL